MRRLFVPGYYSGFSNNKMSLDIAVALAWLTDRVLVPYRFRLPHRNPQPGCLREPAFLPHMFDLPVAWSDECLPKTWLSVPGASVCSWQPLHNSVISVPAGPPLDGPRFLQFRNGRKHVYTFDARLEDAPDLQIEVTTLANYSHLFYLDDVRRRGLIDLMKRMPPKTVYREAAGRIAASLGSFNAVHIRRGDFLFNDLTRDGVTRTVSVSGQEIVANLASRMSGQQPLVICTDGSPQEEVFGPIQKHFRHSIFLDRYLAEDRAMREILAALPGDPESVLVLLNQLVAAQSQVFAGTLFSTFTALIQRERGLQGRQATFLYCYNDFLSPLVRFENCEFLPVDDGPYSWNRVRFPVSADASSWFREWPECFDAGAPAASPAAAPGTLLLTPGDAMLHGSVIRRFEDEGGRQVIGDWTHAADSVSWKLDLPSEGDYLVEVRYGCPPECAGSRYRVGIDGSEELEGRVWNTGGWPALSPWFPLGRLRVPAGSRNLTVRVTEQAAGAAMRLSGVRLAPAYNG